MESIVISDSRSNTKELLTKYIDKYQIDYFLSDFPKIKYILTETERFEVLDVSKTDSDGDSKVLGLMLFGSNYYINLKATTLLFACLLLDMKFTNGLASTVLAITGINFAVTRLSQEERHFLIRAKHICSDKFNIQAITETPFSTKQCFVCSNRNGDICGLSIVQLTSIADTLVDKKILRKNADSYHYVL